MSDMAGITHDGWYNPWDELKKPELRKLADECEASGGFVFRTGHVVVTPGKVTIDGDKITIGEPSFLHVGDGLQFVRFAAALTPPAVKPE